MMLQDKLFFCPKSKSRTQLSSRILALRIREAGQPKKRAKTKAKGKIYSVLNLIVENIVFRRLEVKKVNYKPRSIKSHRRAGTTLIQVSLTMLKIVIEERFRILGL